MDRYQRATAMRCFTCGINWHLTFTKCPNCESPLERIGDEPPDDEETISLALAKLKEKPDPTPEWRKAEFIRMGLAENRAGRAARSKVDLHEFARLIEKGAAPDTALDILR